MSPFHVDEAWARRFATGLPCRARCAVSALRAGIPRVSARFARCAVPLPGGSLRSPPLASPPPRCAAPALRCFRIRRILAPALRIREAAWLARLESRPLTRHGGFPPVPFSGTAFPFVRYLQLGLVLWTPFGGSALTPDAPMMPGAACACLKYPWSAHETPRDPTQVAESASPTRRNNADRVNAPENRSYRVESTRIFRARFSGELPCLLSAIRVHSN